MSAISGMTADRDPLADHQRGARFTKEQRATLRREMAETSLTAVAKRRRLSKSVLHRIRDLPADYDDRGPTEAAKAEAVRMMREGGTYRATAMAAGVSVDAVRSWCRLAGVRAVRKNSGADVRQKAISLVRDVSLYAEAARAVGRARSSVARWCRAAGVSSKPRPAKVKAKVHPAQWLRVTVRGVEYPNFLAACRAHGIHSWTARLRMRKGMAMEEAVARPVDPRFAGRRK